MKLFGKKKNKDIELLKAEMDLLWKIFLILNGVFLLGMTQLLTFDGTANMFDVFLVIMVLLYFFVIVKIIIKYFKNHAELISLLEK